MKSRKFFVRWSVVFVVGAFFIYGGHGFAQAQVASDGTVRSRDTITVEERLAGRMTHAERVEAAARAREARLAANPGLAAQEQEARAAAARVAEARVAALNNAQTSYVTSTLPAGSSLNSKNTYRSVRAQALPVRLTRAPDAAIRDAEAREAMARSAVARAAAATVSNAGGANE